MTAAAERHVAELVREIDPGAMATRFVLLVEVIGDDGDRAVWSLVPDHAKAWDTLGLLDFARSVEYAAARSEP